jgi:predicted nucleotidyltransferase component of viral defense system
VKSEILTPFQIVVAEAFFALPQSKGFLLAGGAALVAQGLSDRPTEDLDFFTAPMVGDVRVARDGLINEADRRGWTCQLLRDYETFCRLSLINKAGDQVLIDLAVDSAPGFPPIIGLIGPTYSPDELAGRKTLALFDRAAARDFVDVFGLAQRYGRDQLLVWAAEIDPGFERSVFIQMLASLMRFPDDEIPIDPGRLQNMREFFESWVQALSVGG